MEFTQGAAALTFALPLPIPVVACWSRSLLRPRCASSLAVWPTAGAPSVHLAGRRLQPQELLGHVVRRGAQTNRRARDAATGPLIDGMI